VPEIIGEYVDRLCNTEMRMKGLPRGVTYPLYERARQKQGAPLTYLAANGLIERVHDGDYVLILTGAGMAPWLPQGETDGPLGAVSLARALARGLGARPVYISEERNLAPIVAASVAAGVSIVSRADIDQRPEAALAVPYPLGGEEALAKAKDMLDDLEPKAIVSIEKLGPNERGVFHSITGKEIPADGQAHAHHLMQEGDRRGILTIGVGDGGNELGYGLIAEDVRELQDYGRRCQCPCGSGVATVVTADVLVSAAVSNWGAYGIAACLAHILEDRDVLHDTNTEYRMLEACATAGALDGALGSQILAVDGIDWQTQQALITMLHSIVANGLKEFRRAF
jgi:hypothetical protein